MQRDERQDATHVTPEPGDDRELTVNRETLRDLEERPGPGSGDEVRGGVDRLIERVTVNGATCLCDRLD
jgi:hypothetical protein